VELDGELARWVESVAGGSIARATRTFGGGSRITWLVDVDRRGVQVPLVLRVETGAGSFSGSELSLHREAVVYRALQATPARVPRLLGEEPQGRALLMERAEGTSELHRLPEAEVDAVLDDFVSTLAALHAVDVDDLDLPGFARPCSPEDHALLDLDLWEGLGRRSGLPAPEITFALAWLRNHAPHVVQRTCLVQGDTGPGNFVAHGGRVSAVIDWEFAHIGDPMDDLAWLSYRMAARHTGIERLPALLTRYSAASGLRIDHAAIDYYGVFVQLRCAITTALALAQGGGALGLAGYLVVHHRYLLDTLRSIAQVEGVAVGDPTRPDVGPTRRTPLYDRAVADLEQGLLPTLQRPEDKLHARSAATLLRHLRGADRFGAALDGEERADLVDLLGPGEHDPTGPAIQAAAAGGGTTSDPAVLRHLVRRATRAWWLWSDGTTAPS
jgi:aminoglycoside phosphotransferase (APT) family kinase protein